MPTVADITAYLEEFAPLALAAEWDNVGLLLGDPAGPVERIMTCLTVTPESAAEAVAGKVQLLITHHPILFRPIKRLTTQRPEEALVLGLARAGVAVYSPHTAFDNTRGGINDMLARRLQLTQVAPLRRQDGQRQCKIVVFVPEADLEKVADALFAAGAGQIGEYSQCSFRLLGTGTFFGSAAANPTIGEKGRREYVSEIRLEAICPEAVVPRAVAAMRRAHSYEEPAYDVYPLTPSLTGGGAGRVGQLAKPVRLQELARTVKTALRTANVEIVGDPDRALERLAIVCGSGGEFLPDAVNAGADVFLTGEMRFHDYLAAQTSGLALVLPGHYATERCGIEELADHLQKRWPNVEVWASRSERDPITSL
jgi:dinuclear metal center YbgI/SA1388 family protein